MPDPANRNDRLLSDKGRKISRGIGPSARSIPALKQNKPGKSVGIGYVGDGLRPSIKTSKHVFEK